MNQQSKSTKDILITVVYMVVSFIVGCIGILSTFILLNELKYENCWLSFVLSGLTTFGCIFIFINSIVALVQRFNIDLYKRLILLMMIAERTIILCVLNILSMIWFSNDYAVNTYLMSDIKFFIPFWIIMLAIFIITKILENKYFTKLLIEINKGNDK